jgi:hypothetical protein
MTTSSHVERERERERDSKRIDDQMKIPTREWTVWVILIWWIIERISLRIVFEQTSEYIQTMGTNRLNSCCDEIREHTI